MCGGIARLTANHRSHCFNRLSLEHPAGGISTPKLFLISTRSVIASKELPPRSKNESLTPICSREEVPGPDQSQSGLQVITRRYMLLLERLTQGISEG